MSGILSTERFGDHWRMFALLYLIPAVCGLVFGVGAATWFFMALGGTVWSTSVLTAIATAVFVLLGQEVTY